MCGGVGPQFKRGAAVNFYKSMGLTSEEVCQLGKWKNTGAFTSHYLRLGAVEKAEGKIVHNISPDRSAEHDQSRTPRTEEDSGGSDWECEAQEDGEILL